MADGPFLSILANDRDNVFFLLPIQAILNCKCLRGVRKTIPALIPPCCAFPLSFSSPSCSSLTPSGASVPFSRFRPPTAPNWREATQVTKDFSFNPFARVLPFTRESTRKLCLFYSPPSSLPVRTPGAVFWSEIRLKPSRPPPVVSAFLSHGVIPLLLHPVTGLSSRFARVGSLSFHSRSPLFLPIFFFVAFRGVADFVARPSFCA